MAKNKKTSSKSQTNKKRSILKKYSFAQAKSKRIKMIIFILLFAGLGAVLIYHSFAASFNYNDEKLQYDSINFARASHGRRTLAAAYCLNNIARKWSAQMASVNKLYHNANIGNQVTNNCSHNWGWIGENIAVYGNSCTHPLTDGCSQIIFDSFVKSPAHYANIMSPQPNYMGVGAYRDDRGKLWITQDFISCYCALSTYKP